MTIKFGPAYRIETPRFIIRCWEPKDAHLLKKSIDESREHLKPWMPWVHGDPEEIEVYINRLRGYRGRFDQDEEYVYGIFNKDEDKVLGGTGFHNRVGPNATEIGYWIHGDHINQGYATEAVLTLTRIAFEVNKVIRVEIHCDPENHASAAIPKKLGYEFEAILKNRQPFLDRLTDSMIWTMFEEQYQESPASKYELQAYNILGEKII